MGVSGQPHAVAALYPRETTLCTYWTEGRVSSRAGVDTDATERILCLCRGLNPNRSVKSVERHYTD
jgi:F420-0:gamma-glutamyl ligase